MKFVTLTTSLLFAFACLNADCEESDSSFHLRSDVDDSHDHSDCMDENQRPWHYHHHPHIWESDDDPTEELDHDTAWPSEREEFSDTLFR